MAPSYYAHSSAVDDALGSIEQSPVAVRVHEQQQGGEQYSGKHREVAGSSQGPGAAAERRGEPASRTRYTGGAEPGAVTGSSVDQRDSKQLYREALFTTGSIA